VTIAVVALVVALVALVLVGTTGRRTRAETEARIAEALRTIGARMESLSEELAAAVERAHEDGLRSRALGDIAGTLDLDEALARTVEAAIGVRGVDAALVRATALDGSALVAAYGIPTDEAQRQVVSWPPDGRAADAVALTYVYPDGADPPGALRSGVAVPLVADDETMGFLAAYSHDPAPRLAADALRRLRAVAAAAGPVIDTARRFRDARAATDEDAVTGLPGRSSFHEALAREVARAHRYERRLALLVLDVDDFARVNDRIGQLGGDEALAQAAAVVRDAVRQADVPYRTGGDEFAVLLPESARADAEGLFARVLAAARGGGIAVSLSGGIAELQPDDDALTLFERAEQSLRHAKERGKGTAAL
jgi:diguanylate cyclase (GGDEF)-like protein